MMCLLQIYRLAPVAAEDLYLDVVLRHAHPQKHVKDGLYHAGLAAETIERTIESLYCFAENVRTNSAPRCGPAVRHLCASKRVKHLESRIAPFQFLELCSVSDFVLRTVAV